jgi:hypothetical protein
MSSRICSLPARSSACWNELPIKASCRSCCYEMSRWVVTKALHLLDLPIVTTVSTTVKTRPATTKTVTTRSDRPRHQQQPSWMFGSVASTIFG